MRIKIIKNGIESEWFSLTKRQHKELLESKPDAALIYIEDIYPNSPNAGTIVRLEFDVFSALTREFVLELNRLKKSDERHLDQRGIDEISPNDNQALRINMDEIFRGRERRREFSTALEQLTPVQRRRFLLKYQYGFSYRKIADLEGTSYSAVKYSIDAAKNFLKKYLTRPCSNGDFLSD